MMKKLLYAVVLSLAFTSCAKDLGNYDYHDLNEPEISGIAEKLSVLSLSKMELTPVLTPNTFPDELYSFEWRAIALSADQTSTVIGTSRNLDYQVELPAGGYTLLFTVTEKASGVFWRKTVELQVSEATSEGWMVLCADGADDRTRLDMVSMVTNQTYLDILKDKGMPQFKGPRSIQTSKYADKDSPYYLITDEGTTRLSRNGLSWQEEYRLRYEMGTGANPSPSCITDVVSAKLMVAGTKAYYADCQIGVGLFGEISSTLKVAPAVGSNINTTLILVPISLLYDIEGKRFMGYAPTLRASDVGGYKPLQDMNELVELLRDMPNGGKVTGTAFDKFPTGLDFVYMENTKYDPNSTNMGVTYTILTDGSKRSLYGIQLGELWKMSVSTVAYALGKVTYGDLSGCVGINQATHFAFSSLKNYMYYAANGVVYRVDLSNQPFTATQQFALPSETITCLKFNLYSSSTNIKSYDLVVGSVKGDVGTLRVYEGFNSDGDFKGATPTTYSGLGRIVDVTYRELLQ